MLLLFYFTLRYKGTFVHSHFIENVEYRIVQPAGPRGPAGFIQNGKDTFTDYFLLIANIWDTT